MKPAATLRTGPIILLALLLPLSICRAEDHPTGTPFTTVQGDLPMMVTGTLSGNFSILPDKVLVRDLKGQIIVQQGLGVRVFPERRIVGLRAVLAKWADHRGYDIVAKAEMHSLDQTLAIGQSLPIDGIEFDIPTGNLTPDQVKHTWLEFEVQMEIPGGERKGDVGSTYLLCDVFLTGEKTYLRMGPPKGVPPPDPSLFHTE